MQAKEFEQKIIRIFDDLKYNYISKKDVYTWELRNKGNVIGKMFPVFGNSGSDESMFVEFLSEWRRKHFDAFPTQFPVTEEGTRKWLREHVIGRRDRILFMITSPEMAPIGHLGLSNFDFEKQEAEIDNVVRGIDNVYPGVMTLALDKVSQWSFDSLAVRRLLLRVFKDNQRAVRFYERCGFRQVREIPLHKTVEGKVVKYEEVYPGKPLSTDRIFLLMERYPSRL